MARVLGWAGVMALALVAAVSPAAAAPRFTRDAVLGGSVQLDQSAYTAHEDQRELTITIVRTGDALLPETVGYGVKQQDAQNGIDFDSIPNTLVTIPAGESSISFQVPILDQGMTATPVHALAYLYTAWPEPLGANTNSIITILHDDPLAARDASNPLGVPDPVAGNPIAGAKLYVDPNSAAAQAEQQYAQSNPEWASALNVIASEPGAKRFWMWNMQGNIEGQVAHYLEDAQAQQPGTTVMLSSYNLVHGGCGATATPTAETQYENFMNQMAAGIGNFHVIYFLELDSLITTPCLSPAQLAIRMAELRYAIGALERAPHVVVYLDAGAADAVGAARMANLLTQAGIAQAQGFFLNSTHFDWTATELGYGEAISKLLGGATHFIVNTGENGRGPLRPADRVHHGNEVLCNPPGRGLGPLSVSDGVAQPTGYPNADGFLWFSNPGGSGGACRPGAPPAGHFWPAYVVMLAQNRVDQVEGPAYAPKVSVGAARGAVTGQHHRRKHHKHHRKHRHHA